MKHTVEPCGSLFFLSFVVTALLVGTPADRKTTR